MVSNWNVFKFSDIFRAQNTAGKCYSAQRKASSTPATWCVEWSAWRRAPCPPTADCSSCSSASVWCSIWFRRSFAISSLVPPNRKVSEPVLASWSNHHPLQIPTACAWTIGWRLFSCQILSLMPIFVTCHQRKYRATAITRPTWATAIWVWRSPTTPSWTSKMAGPCSCPFASSRWFPCREDPHLVAKRRPLSSSIWREWSTDSSASPVTLFPTPTTPIALNRTSSCRRCRSQTPGTSWKTSSWSCHASICKSSAGEQWPSGCV